MAVKDLNQKDWQVVGDGEVGDGEGPSSAHGIMLHRFEPHIGVILSYTGPAPMELLGTRAIFSLTQARPGNVWSASDFTIDSDSLFVSLFTPANAVIGSYTLKIEMSQGQGHSSTHPLGTFILLFNPWSAGVTCSWVVMLT